MNPLFIEAPPSQSLGFGLISFRFLIASPRTARGFPQFTNKYPHLHEWTVSRNLVLLTSRSICIFRRHLGQFICRCSSE